MTQVGDDCLRDRLSRALPAAMKARDRPAMTALRSALAAIDNAGAVDPTRAVRTDEDPQVAPSEARPSGPDETGSGPAESAGVGSQHPSTGSGPGHSDLGAARAGHPEFAGTAAGVGATEVERRSLSQAQMEAIVRTEIADRETAATGYERAGQPERAERLRAEANVLLSHLNTT
ncbi:MAG TPA: hypothetical protein VJB61_12030 [Actinomycetota bacterium]